MSMFNPKPAIGVLPADGWEARFYSSEEEAEAEETQPYLKVPLVGWLIHADNTGFALIANGNGHVNTVAEVARGLRTVIKVCRVTEDGQGQADPEKGNE